MPIYIYICMGFSGKNIAMILAAGSGRRMGLDVPKQFVNVYGKPVVIYTLEAFEHNPLIDSIVVVCIDGWQEMLLNYAGQYKISKLKKVVEGGATVQESIKKGIDFIASFADDDDLVVIHDGVRPLVDDDVLSDVIIKCQKYGNAVSSLPYYEQIFVKADEISTEKYIQRNSIRRVMTPQAYKCGKLKKAYDRAFKENKGIGEASYANTLMVDLGEKLFFASGSEKNIKLTTKENLELFKFFLKSGAGA